jgi:hypothetical protein
MVRIGIVQNEILFIAICKPRKRVDQSYDKLFDASDFASINPRVDANAKRVMFEG